MALNAKEQHLSDAVDELREQLDYIVDTLADIDNAEDREAKADYREQLESNAIDVQSTAQDVIKALRPFVGE